eukprot:SAG31_NODE_3845_length_3820_cov_14.896657_2_plen_383_part_00
MGGINWLISNLVDIEKFIVAGSGVTLTSMSLKLGYDYPPGNLIFLPLGVVGVLVSLLGTLKAIPILEVKFPDLMLKLHKLQVAVSVGLGFCFSLFTRAARNVGPFVESNWDRCEPINITSTFNVSVCEIVGQPDFSFAKYAEENNYSLEDVKGSLEPICYSAGVACAMTAGVIVGGSNGSKFMYNQMVMSRKEELAGKAAGADTTKMRRDALVKKVRGQREADIKEVSKSMHAVAINKLEETALMMEFATGVPMEQHYDLVAHDEIVNKLKKTAEAEDRAGSASRGIASLDDLDEDDPEIDKEKTGKPKRKKTKVVDEEGDQDAKPKQVRGYFLVFCATIRERRDFNREIYGTNRESVTMHREYRWPVLPSRLWQDSSTQRH